jgi:2'-5' RNA ligase
MIRAFVSIDIPKEIKKEIVRIQNSLPEFRGKKTEAENLHLTLKFFGEIDEDVMNKVKDRLRKIKFDELELELDSIGVFSQNFIKIIWLHIIGSEKLQKRIDESLKDLFRTEDRFMGHLTIARVKNIKDKRKFLEDLNRMKIPMMKFKVREFELKKSTLTEQGPIYEDIETYLCN